MPEDSQTPINDSAITPALSKDVSFTEKVNAVDQALKSRSAAVKDLKQKWAALIKVMADHDITVSSRRGDAVQAQSYVQQIEVVQPQNPLLNDLEMVKLASNYSSLFRNILESSTVTKALESRFPGIREFAYKVMEVNELRYEIQKIDKEATKDARAQVQPVVDEYLAALEAYDETVESVANVKEYIAVVKDVAEISAIAQGAVAPKN